MATSEAIARPRFEAPPALTRALAADLSRPLPFALLGAVFLLLRAPYLNYGHGTDPDAWRVALTAHELLDTGRYFPSRLPGNPLHELMMTPLVAGGWIATNLATALVSLLGVYLFARIVQHLKLPNAAVVTAGFAFTPLLFINSIATMDYMWTLTAVLAAYYATLKGQPLIAGVCLGLAVGFRLQSVIVWAPLAYLLWRQHVDLRRLAAFSLAAGGTALLAFAPVLSTYGTEFYNFYDAKVEPRDVLRLLGKEALGIFGGLAILAAVAFSRQRLVHLPRDAVRDPQVGVCLAMIVLYFVTFFRLPHEIAYLIPVFPFGFFLMARYFKRAALVGAVAAVLISGYVDLTTPVDTLELESFRHARLGRGLILSNADTMSGQHAFVREVTRAAVPDRSVVMAGFVFPQLAVRERDRLQYRILERDYEAISILSDRGETVDRKRDVRYVWLLTYEAFQALQSQGYNMFLVPDASGGTAALYEYRPTLFGATYLELDRPSPTAGKGTASTDR